METCSDIRSPGSPTTHPLLPPRLVPAHAPVRLAADFQRYARCPPTHQGIDGQRLALMAEHRSDARALSIFRAVRFGKRVVTHSYADANFHGHRLAVSSEQRPLWFQIRVEFSTLAQRLVHPTAPVLLTKRGPLGR